MLRVDQPLKEPFSAIRGWLLLFALLLTIWEPLTLGLLASSLLTRILDRPEALALLSLRLVSTAAGLAAGVALLTRRPHAVRMAQAALVLSALTGVLMYSTPWFPRNHPPGLTLPLVVMTLGYNSAWFLYLVRSRRVRETFERSAPARPVLLQLDDRSDRRVR